MGGAKHYYDNDPVPGYDYWDDHKDFPDEQWRLQVSIGLTRLGYWMWVKKELGHQKKTEAANEQC